MSDSNEILVIGAGELGSQVLRSLARHPRRQGAIISVLLRPSSIASTDWEKVKELDALRNLGVQFVSGDVSNDSEEYLSSIFREYNTIIGNVLKILIIGQVECVDRMSTEG